MNNFTAKGRLFWIQEAADDHDDETAHRMERGLHMDVLTAIRDGEAEDPKELARIALQSRKIKFNRWFA